jgi:tripartite ATP-independent transporter DctM subunit
LLLGLAWRYPQRLPALPRSAQQTSAGTAVRATLPPLLLIVTVLGSILSGIATPTEAAGVGAVGAGLLAALRRQLSPARLLEIGMETMQVTSMVFMILIGAAIFSLVFRGFGGDELIIRLFDQLPGGLFGAIALVMLLLFLLGFILDFIEITFVVVPVVAPILFTMGVDPVWLGIMIAVNLQTSFLTPPFGFALFYLRGVAPVEVKTSDIYRGVMPFILLQMLLLVILAVWPKLTTWLPDLINH